MIELCKQLESRFGRKLTKEEMIILKLAFAEGVDKGKKDQKEYILNIIADRA